MSETLKLFILFILSTVLHWTFMTVLGGVGVNLNVMLLFACAACAFLKPQYGYPVAFVCGLFLDFFGVKLFGNNALTFTLCALMIYSLEKRLDFEAPIPQMITIFALSLFAVLFNVLMLRIFAGFSTWPGFGAFLSGAVLNALLAPAVFWAVRRVCCKEIKN